MAVNPEYRIDLKIRNNLLLRKIELGGYDSLMGFCRSNKISLSLYDIVNMRESPLNKDGQFKPFIIKSAEVLNCSPEDFFTPVQMQAILKTNKRIIQINEAEIKFILGSNEEPKLLEDIIYNDQMKVSLEKIMDNLSEREAKVLRLRYGMEDGKERSLREVGEIIGVQRERVRQIESRALRKLRHPLKCNILRDPDQM